MKKTTLFFVMAMLCLFFKVNAQSQRKLTGLVTNQYQQPLTGATIKIKSTSYQTKTDSEGRFSISSTVQSGTLMVSYTGYQAAELNFSESNITFSVSLTEDNADLKEIQVNAGYYSVKEKERTGNIQRISATTLEKQPVSDPLLAMQNRIPGLQITQTTGVAGGGVSVQIRGRSSINTQVGNDPLYIIDGVTYPSSKTSLNYVGNILGTAGTSPLSLINPTDIESIEVLKDADATAIYGSRGANGVILIKTKQGKSGANRINANFSQGYSQVAGYIQLLNTEQYIEMRNEALKNDGKSISATDYDINGTWDRNKYTDWQKELIGGTAPLTKASVNFSGGSNKVNYMLGSTYYREGTVYPGDFNFNRIGLQSSLNFGGEKDRLKVNFTASYNHTANNLLRTDLTSLITLAPNAPDPYDAYGKLNWQNNTVYQNPMAYLLVKNAISTDNLIGNVTIDYQLSDQLSFKTSAGYNLIKTDEFNKIPLNYTSPAYSPTPADRTSYFSDVSNRTWMAEPQLNYSSKVGSGKLQALIGMSLQENISELRSVRASNFSSDALMENLGAAATIVNNLSSYAQYRYLAAFARINYSLHEKYFINLTARRDGSSRFGADKQFANFGAVGAAWIFSEENFIKNSLSFLSFGKLRASYGLTGNDQIPDYGYLQLYGTSGTYQGQPTLIPSFSNIGNRDFAWETNRKLELATQLGFLDNHFTIEASWFQNRSSNQLVGEPLPLSTGSLTVRANRPALVQNTGWELLAGIKILNKNDWRWSTSINLTIPKNKLIAYPGLAGSGDAMELIVGEPLTIYKIYNVRGVNSQTGLYDIEDYNGDGLLNDDDRYLYKFTGQYFYGGFQNTISYKNFSIDLLVGFTRQNGRNYLASQVSPGLWSSNTYYNANQPEYVLDRWRVSGDQTTVQKYSTNSASSSPYTKAKNDGGESISDASFVRLKNVALSYSLPASLLKKLNIIKADLSLSGQNLFTLTRYKGLDPETQSMSILPPLRTLAIGINVTF